MPGDEELREDPTRGRSRRCVARRFNQPPSDTLHLPAPCPLPSATTSAPASHLPIISAATIHGCAHSPPPSHLPSPPTHGFVQPPRAMTGHPTRCCLLLMPSASIPFTESQWAAMYGAGGKLWPNNHDKQPIHAPPDSGHDSEQESRHDSGGEQYSRFVRTTAELH
jgi:hypothetical protein